MPLLGTAAMLLSFDVDDDAIEEHDRWHTQEHLPERLSIPGFRRGTRWVGSTSGAPRYLVLYEVESLATLGSAAYLDRLNHPTAWTTALMPRYRGMTRGLCTVLGSFGFGQGSAAALIRFSVAFAPGIAPTVAEPHRWLLEEALPTLPRRAGLGSAHLLQGARAAAMTNEQRIRGGADRGVESALIVTGYDEAAVAACAQALCATGGLPAYGAGAVSSATYRWSYSLSSAELGGGA